MCDLDTGGGITLHVRQLGIHCGVVEEGSNDVPGIIEHYLHVNVLRSLDDIGHVVSLVVKHDGHPEAVKS